MIQGYLIQKSTAFIGSLIFSKKEISRHFREPFDFSVFSLKISFKSSVSVQLSIQV